MSILGLIVNALKLLVPVFAFLMGKRSARKEMEMIVVKEELKDAKEAAKSIETIHSMSDAQLVDSVYERPKGK